MVSSGEERVAVPGRPPGSGADRVTDAVGTSVASAVSLADWSSSDLGAEAIESRAGAENFPVAVRWIPASRREELMALYGYARLVDQVGDDVEGDRLALLDALSADVARIADGEPEHPVVRRLAAVVRRHALPVEPLERLIEANRRDQVLKRVVTWDELVGTCTYSANPVGELVLGLFGARNARTVRWSDAVCTALQVVEHCQDVTEDFERGRVYLPAEDLRRFGCRDADLVRSPASPALRGAVSLQVERARALLTQADPLLAELRGLARVLVAGYAAGGLATCDALERHGFDVVSSAVRPAKRDLVRHWIRGAAGGLVRGALRGKARAAAPHDPSTAAGGGPTSTRQSVNERIVAGPENRR